MELHRLCADNKTPGTLEVTVEYINVKDCNEDDTDRLYAGKQDFI